MTPPNEARHRMSGININRKFEHRSMPLIGALNRQAAMLPTIFPVLIALLIAGCSSSRPVASMPTQTEATTVFVQNGIKIVPPLRHAHLSAGFDDGGTMPGSFTDAAGTTFRFYIDHRIGTKTPGDIYLNAYPSDPKSVHVLDQQEFREKIGHFESWTNSF